MIDKNILLFFAKYIETELGIVYGEVNYFQLESRLTEICKVFNIANPLELYKKCSHEGITGTLKQYLLDLATNNETSFFRDPKVFECIKSKIIPELLTSMPPASQLRCWSVASSSGQEAYSLSIIFSQLAEGNLSFPTYEIFGTDISDRILEKAKKGHYTHLEVQRGLPIALLLKHFTKNTNDMYEISSQLRTRVNFKKMNLLNISDVPGTFDLILIRNVLIYQNDERKKKIINEIKQYLRPHGYLILGSAESLIGLSDDFDQRIHNGVVYYCRKLKAAA